jgi:hypothetical protein
LCIDAMSLIRCLYRIAVKTPFNTMKIKCYCYVNLDKAFC